MNQIGDNIKLLRKAKGVTQEELAEAVHVSFQAVSKWENGGAPDIGTLPALASFFGVSIDELMGFKLNALTDKERFIRFMADTGVLKLGSCDLHGYRSEYYIESERFTTNAQYAKLGEYFADCIRESGITFDCIIGMAYHGISLSVATALALYNKYGVTVSYCHDRKLADSRGREFCGHTPEDGERVLIVDDLVNSGKTLIGRIERLKESVDITIAAVAVIVERYETEMREHHENGADLLRERYGARILSVVNGDDIARAVRAGIV